jgi:hypothetical protein
MEWKGWVVEAVDGVAHQIGPGGNYVILSAQAMRVGTIRFTSSGTYWTDLPLSFIETTLDEAWIRPLLHSSVCVDLRSAAGIHCP